VGAHREGLGSGGLEMIMAARARLVSVLSRCRSPPINDEYDKCGV
jgi:hypothetical protein